ncbi:hypothetical protein GF345_00295 [Candidatus Woesearchaeota archaeon]|nr:hypothetical protein [Candidatus Woesearchaeota archaeon]
MNKEMQRFLAAIKKEKDRHIMMVLSEAEKDESGALRFSTAIPLSGKLKSYKRTSDGGMLSVKPDYGPPFAHGTPAYAFKTNNIASILYDPVDTGDEDALKRFLDEIFIDSDRERYSIMMHSMYIEGKPEKKNGSMLRLSNAVLVDYSEIEEECMMCDEDCTGECDLQPEMMLSRQAIVSLPLVVNDTAAEMKYSDIAKALLPYERAECMIRELKLEKTSHLKLVPDQ